MLSSSEPIFVKLAVTVHNNVADLSDLGEAASILQENHFWGIEPDIRDPRQIEARWLKEIVSDHGLHIPALATGRGFALDGLSLSDADPMNREKAIELLRGHIDLANQLRTNVVVGLLRGRRTESNTPEECLRRLTDSLRICGRYAAQKGCKIFLEAINHQDTNIANTAKESADLISTVGSHAVQLLLDTYHMDIEENSISETIRAHIDNLGHFHLADRKRCTPGTAGIGFHEIIKELQALGYQGTMTVEIPLEPDMRVCIEQVRQNLNNMGIYSVATQKYSTNS